VKSLRAGGISMDEAYGRVERGEVWLMQCDIKEYANTAQAWSHEPKRRRKLLLHRREIAKFASQAYEKNLTLVPLKMYFKEGRAKVLMGICKGKKTYDKRESLKKKDMQRDIDRAMRR
jgi:SsrA-binding protein